MEWKINELRNWLTRMTGAYVVVNSTEEGVNIGLLYSWHEGKGDRYHHAIYSFNYFSLMTLDVEDLVAEAMRSVIRTMLRDKWVV